MYTQQLEILAGALAQGAVPERDVTFASSLVNQASSSRGLSDKQWYWVCRLADAITKRVESKPVVGDMGRVYKLFDTARQHLRFPKIHLTTKSGRTLKLYVSTVRSRVPDTVNVVDSVRDIWYGRVHKDGSWESGNAPADEVNSVAETLAEFAANPEEIAARSGHLSGNCCFCNRALTDERSTSVGYGPVCAAKWGLAWG